MAAGDKWTAEDDVRLRKYFGKMEFRDIGLLLRRSAGAVENRCRRLDLRMRDPAPAWTEAELALASRLRLEGATGAFAARAISALGVAERTRSAVLGHWRRIGATQRARRSHPGTTRIKVRASAAAKAQPMIKTPAQEPAPIEPPIGVLELTADMCRYPHGSVVAGTLRYCGHPQAPGRSMCTFHVGLCYQKASARG